MKVVDLVADVGGPTPHCHCCGGLVAHSISVDNKCQ